MYNFPSHYVNGLWVNDVVYSDFEEFFITFARYRAC